MMLNEGYCLSVSNIKRSIDLMDEFVDGDYEYGVGDFLLK